MTLSRHKPLLRKTPLKPGTKRMKQGRKCSQAKDANGMTPAMRDFALREIGCIVARMRGLGFIPGTKHHLLTTGNHGTGKRRGEAFTVLLSDWSHQGRPLLQYGWDTDTCRKKLGPSYAEEAEAFRELYPDDVLLSETEKALAEWRRNTMGLRT